MKTAIPFTSLSLEEAATVAAVLFQQMGRRTYSARELSICARELRRVHSAGRQSMYREMADRLGLTVPERG